MAEEVARVVPVERQRKLARFLSEPRATTRGWDYGADDERVTVWIVGQSPDDAVALAYAEDGFGPDFPWGFVFPNDDSCGTDAQWHSGLEDAAIGAGLLDAPPGYVVPGPRD